jgi:hypothetical protein
MQAWNVGADTKILCYWWQIEHTFCQAYDFRNLQHCQNVHFYERHEYLKRLSNIEFERSQCSIVD